MTAYSGQDVCEVNSSRNPPRNPLSSWGKFNIEFFRFNYLKVFKMNNLIINIFNQDVECITDLITCGFNVTHFERMALGVGKTALLVNVNALDGLTFSITDNSKINDALFAYYATKPLEIIYQLPNQKAVKRIERWGIELDERDIRKPYDGKINAAVCRYAVGNAQLLAQCKAVVNARKLAANIAEDCLGIAINGGNTRVFSIDFGKIDKDELFTCLCRLDYEVAQDANDKLIVSW